MHTGFFQVLEAPVLCLLISHCTPGRVLEDDHIVTTNRFVNLVLELPHGYHEED